MANGFSAADALASNPYYLGPAGTSRERPGFAQEAAAVTAVQNPRLAAAAEQGQPPAQKQQYNSIREAAQSPQAQGLPPLAVPGADPGIYVNNNPQPQQPNKDRPVSTTPAPTPTPAPPAPPQGEPEWNASQAMQWAKMWGMGDMANIPTFLQSLGLQVAPGIDFSKVNGTWVQNILMQVAAGLIPTAQAKQLLQTNINTYIPGQQPTPDPIITPPPGNQPPTDVEDAPPPEYPGTPHQPDPLPPTDVEDAPPPEYPGTPPAPPTDVEDAPPPEYPGTPPAPTPAPYVPQRTISNNKKKPYQPAGLSLLSGNASAAGPQSGTISTAPRVESGAAYRDAGSRLAARRGVGGQDPFALRRR